MKIEKFNNYKQMCSNIVDRISSLLHCKPDALLCLAAGQTYMGVFEEMKKRHEKNKMDFRYCRFIGLDEWKGLGRNNNGSMIDFMYENLFTPLNINESNIIFFDGRAEMEMECKRIETYFNENGPIDFLLLGVGMNGHLGLNEPGVPFNLRSHIVKLAPFTKKTARKYFHSPKKLTDGITLGMENIKESKDVILAIHGEHKAFLVKRIMESDISCELPATYIKTLSQATLCYDINI